MLTTSARGRMAAALSGRRLLPSASPLATIAAAAACALAAWQFVVAPLGGAFSGEFEDFSGYAQAAHAVAAGLSPYAHFDGSTIVMSGFDYPPVVAVLLRPLDLLAARWQQVLWLLLNLGCLVGGAMVAARALLPASWPRTRIGLAAALSFPPATYNLWHGQVNLVIFLLVAVALSDYVAGRRNRCAVVIGVAASIKLAPVVLLLLLARRGWWRAMAAAAATMLAAAVVGVAALGWPVTRQYVGILAVLDRDNGWIYNQSWNGVVNRLVQRSVLAPEAPGAALHAVVLLLGLATVAAVWFAVSRAPRTRAERGAEFGCAVLAMLLVGAVTWYPVYVEALIPAGAALALAHQGGAQRRPLLAWTGAAVAAAVAASAVIASMSMTGLVGLAAGPRWWLFLQACSLPALAVAGLLAITVRRLWAVSPAVAGVR